MREAPSGAAVSVGVAKFSAGDIIAAHGVDTAGVGMLAKLTDVIVCSFNRASSPPPVGLAVLPGYMFAPNNPVAVLLNTTAAPITLAADVFVTVMAIPID
jgi:hypothetical protein